jgi:hypothetical protein
LHYFYRFIFISENCENAPAQDQPIISIQET